MDIGESCFFNVKPGKVAFKFNLKGAEIFFRKVELEVLEKEIGTQKRKCKKKGPENNLSLLNLRLNQLIKP